MRKTKRKAADITTFAKEVISIIPHIHVELLRHHPKILTSNRVTFPQMVVADILLHRRRCKMTDLSKILGITKSAVTGLIDRLIKAGLITRMRSYADRRIVYVTLTSKGLRFSKTLSKYKLQIIGALFKNITPRERTQYLNVLRKVRKNLIQKKTGAL